MFSAIIMATDSGLCKLLTSIMDSDRVMGKRSKDTNIYENTVMRSNWGTKKEKKEKKTQYFSDEILMIIISALPTNKKHITSPHTTTLWKSLLYSGEYPYTSTSHIKATLSFYKLIPKNAQMTTLYTNLSLYITFTMIYYIRQK